LYKELLINNALLSHYTYSGIWVICYKWKLKSC